MGPVDLLESSLGCRHGDDPACAHQARQVVDVKVAFHPTPMAAVHSPCHQDAKLTEEYRSGRGLPVMAWTGLGPAVEECCDRIVHRLNRPGSSDVPGGNH